MTNDVKARFKRLGTFPSPPGIAQEIIALAKDPDTGIAEVTKTIAKDPALAAKILRTANSPMYAQRRRSDNLRQALTVVGVEAALTMCLSFSIAHAHLHLEPIVLVELQRMGDSSARRIVAESSSILFSCLIVAS